MHFPNYSQQKVDLDKILLWTTKYYLMTINYGYQIQMEMMNGSRLISSV